MNIIYMDHASATPVREQVIKAMVPYFDRQFGNPSAIYDMGFNIKQVIQFCFAGNVLQRTAQDINGVDLAAVFYYFGDRNREISSAASKIGNGHSAGNSKFIYNILRIHKPAGAGFVDLIHISIY